MRRIVRRANDLRDALEKVVEAVSTFGVTAEEAAGALRRMSRIGRMETTSRTNVPESGIEHADGVLRPSKVPPEVSDVSEAVENFKKQMLTSSLIE